MVYRIRRVLSFLLISCMVFAAAPVVVFSAVGTVYGGYTVTHLVDGNSDYYIDVSGGVYELFGDGDRAVIVRNSDCVLILTGVNRTEPWSRLQIRGNSNVTLYLVEGTINTFRSTGTRTNANEEQSGIAVAAASSLTIKGPGVLNAIGGRNSAGIGGFSGSGAVSGKIIIESGVVNATGGTYAPGIGAGDRGTNGPIIINGGTINAAGGQYAPGIGGGNYAPGGNVTVNGGTIIAAGGQYAAGIGGGDHGPGANTVINGGAVTATGGQRGAGIGGGSGASGGVTKIYGGAVTATGGDGATGIGGGAGGGGGDTTITGGSVYPVNQNRNIRADRIPTNGAAYGGRDLYMAEIRLTDANLNILPNTKISIRVDGDVPYSYNAFTNGSGIAHIWLPDGAYAFMSLDPDTGAYYDCLVHVKKPPNPAEYAPGANSTEIAAQNRYPQWSFNVNPGNFKSYGSVRLSLDIWHNNPGIHPDKAVAGVKWYRESVENPVNSQESFDSGYAAATPENRGVGGTGEAMNLIGDNGPNKRFYSLSIEKNGRYWIQIHYIGANTGIGVFHAAYLDVDNIYTPVSVFHKGAQADGSQLYAGARARGANTADTNVYGIPYDLDGVTIISSPSLGYDRIHLVGNDLSPYWRPAASGNPRYTDLTLNADFFSVHPDLNINNATDPYIFTYEKDPGGWNDWETFLNFTDENGNPVTVNHPVLGTVTREVKEWWTPKYGSFQVSGDMYMPPPAVLPSYLLAGYRMEDAAGLPATTANQYISFPREFNVIIPRDNYNVYIIYALNRVAVTERYRLNGAPGTALCPDSSTALDPGAPYAKTAPAIANYVCVGHMFDGDAAPEYAGPAGSSYNAPEAAVIARRTEIDDDAVVTFIYEPDANGNGIPDSAEREVAVNRIGVRTDGTRSMLKSTQTVIGRDGATGDIPNGGNILADAHNPSTQWRFDYSLVDNAAPGGVSRNITWGLDASVDFYYDADSRGVGVADKNQTVTERYGIYGDYGAELGAGGLTYKPVGEAYAKEAPVFEGYTAVGWIADREYTAGVSDSDMCHITAGDRTVKAEIGVTSADASSHTVTFIYRPSAAPVTVVWEGITASGHTVALDSVTIAGYDGEKVTVNRAAKPQDNFWVADGAGEDSFTFTTGVSGAAPPGPFVFRFREQKIYSLIRQSGVSGDGRLSYGADQVVSAGIKSMEISALEGFFGYRAAGYTVEDAYGNDITPAYGDGTGARVTIDPSKGDQTITFKYESTAASLKIRAVEKHNENNILFENTVYNLTAGQIYAAIAPFIDPGWELIGDVIVPVRVNGGDNSVVFEYEPILDNVAVLLCEAGADGVPVSPARYIKVLGVEEDRLITPAEYAGYLSGCHYTPYTTGNVTAAKPGPVFIYYTKDTVDTRVVPVNQITGYPVDGAERTAGIARKGEMFMATAHTVDGYKLTDASVKEAYADPSANPADVPFYYKKEVSGNVSVYSYYYENDRKIYLSAGVIELNEGVELTVNASDYDFPGFIYTGVYIVNGGAERTGGAAVITVREAGDAVEFIYADARRTVTAATDPPGYGTVYKIADGRDIYVPAPYIPGYVLDSYDINYADGVQPDVTGAVGAGSGVIALKRVTENVSLTFRYVTLEYAAEQTRVPAAVKIRYLNRSDSNTPLKEYTLTGFYAGQRFTADAPESFNMNGRKYKLDGAEPALTLTLVEGDNPVDVYYLDDGAENTATDAGGGGSAGSTGGGPAAAAGIISGGSNGADADGGATASAEDGGVTVSAEGGGAEPGEKIRELLETERHIKYVGGNPDGTVCPDGEITRAETAALFWRLMKATDKYDFVENIFGDVNGSEWYAQAVNFLAVSGILKGYADGGFKPEQKVTRAEFAVIASRFDILSAASGGGYGDINESHWAYEFVASVNAKGWMQGYPDGSFKPENGITRGEAVAVINRMLRRTLEKEGIPPEFYNLYADLPASHWAFADITEASVTHEYARRGTHEIWTY